MNLLERARRAQADRDGRDAVNTDEVDQRERAALARRATVILEMGLEPPVNAAMLRPVFNERGHRALYRFEYEGMRFVVGRYWHGNPGDSTLLAVQLEQHRGMPEWPPPRPQSVSNTRWAPAGYHAVYSLANLADALDQSTLSTGEPPVTDAAGYMARRFNLAVTSAYGTTPDHCRYHFHPPRDDG
jgi:hypothetical protein